METRACKHCNDAVVSDDIVRTLGGMDGCLLCMDKCYICTGFSSSIKFAKRNGYGLMVCPDCVDKEI